MIRALITGLTLTLLAPLSLHAKEVIVKPGETLSEIAEQHRISISSILSLNSLKSPHLIEVGQELKIPEIQSKSECLTQI